MEFTTETTRPNAEIGSRFIAYLVDVVISISALTAAITIFGLLRHFAENQSSFSLNISLKGVGFLLVLAAFLFVIWNKWFRVLNHRSTLGMKLMGLEIECAQAGLSGSSITFLSRNPFLFWVNIGNKKGQKPAGDMDEECMDSQFGKGFLALGALFVFSLINCVLYPLAILVSRFIFLIRNLIGGNDLLHMVDENSIQGQDKIIIGIVSIPEVVILLFIVFGFIFVLSKERRSVADYFCGVRVVNSKNGIVDDEHKMESHW